MNENELTEGYPKNTTDDTSKLNTPPTPSLKEQVPKIPEGVKIIADESGRMNERDLKIALGIASYKRKKSISVEIDQDSIWKPGGKAMFFGITEVISGGVILYGTIKAIKAGNVKQTPSGFSSTKTAGTGAFGLIMIGIGDIISGFYKDEPAFPSLIDSFKNTMIQPSEGAGFAEFKNIDLNTDINQKNIR